MGQNFSSEPVVEKDTERDHNDTFNVAVSSCQGWRMSQEDNHTMMLELPGEHKAAFFAVYDGHGSARVSKHASESLWKHLVENEMYIKGNFKEALEQAFLTFDREVNASYNAQLAGTTAICLLIADHVIYCANIGDSRAVACVNCRCVPLSFDHKPENPQELKRILAAGGYVLGNRVNGNLALSRAFGDFHYKGNDQLPPEHQIVSPCPDVKTIEMNDEVDFLVLACDGIWDVLSNEEVVEFVISRLEHQMEPGLICEQLTTRCLATDYELVIGCDNMTVLLVCYTRGRSWAEFCTDIFEKNSHKMGIPRTPPSLDPSEYPDDEVPPIGQEVRDQRQIQLHQQQLEVERQQAEQEIRKRSVERAMSGPTTAANEMTLETGDVTQDNSQTGDAGTLGGCTKNPVETTDSRKQCSLIDSSAVESVNGDDEKTEEVEEDDGLSRKNLNADQHESQCKQEQQNETSRDGNSTAPCNQEEDNIDSGDQQRQQSGCKEGEKEENKQNDELKEEQNQEKEAKIEKEVEQNLECETK